MDTPEVRYARSGTVNIAYQVIGAGPIDLLYIPGWISHLDLYWEEPAVSRFLRRLARGFRLTVQVQVGNPARDIEQIDGAVADNLIGDVDRAAPCVTHLRGTPRGRVWDAVSTMAS